MKIILLGADGQVGRALLETLPALGTVVALHRNHLDLTDHAAVRTRVGRESPGVIVNAAAYTAVDRAEVEPEAAWAVNAGALQVIAEEATRSGALLVHYSTDYVFDGEQSQPYREADTPRPLNAYGRSKLGGEHAIQASGCRHLILRTSWVYGEHRPGFPQAILRAARERESLRVVDDQLGAPTSAERIAGVTAACIRSAAPSSERALTGVYHLSASGVTSWHAYARVVVELATRAGMRLRLAPESIAPASSTEYGAPAKRPANSVLDTRKLCAAFGVKLPHWQLDVERLVARLAAQASGAEEGEMRGATDDPPPDQ